jgi:hypothetical protein
VSNIFTEITDKIQNLHLQRTERLNRKNEKESANKKYWKDLEDKLQDVKSLMSDKRYPVMQEFLSELHKKLNERLLFTLSGNFNDKYTRDSRTDEAAIISAQIVILKSIIEYPDKLLETIRKEKEKNER